MKPSKYRLAFDKKASNLASLSPDGRLKVWETTNGNLCHEWIPPAGLGATCSCLCWVQDDSDDRPKAKKSKKSNPNSNDGLKSHIVFGTLQGSMVLLNCDTLDVVNKPVNEHQGKINDICYCDKKETIYSGSNDKFVIEWSYPLMTVKSKWKADKHCVYKVLVSPDGNCILSAGRSIKLWNIETKELLQKFTGHASPVTNLFFVPMSNGKSFKEECYFISTAEDDDMINAWHHDSSSQDTNAVCCFMTEGYPGCIDGSISGLQQLHLGSACRDGKVCLFTQVLNGRLTKPVKSAFHFKLVNSINEETSAPGLRIFAMKLLDSDAVLLVYGSPINPTFEKIKLSSVPNGSSLKRETTKGLLHKKSDQSTRKSSGTADVNRSVAIDSNAPIAIQHVEQRDLATSQGNRTADHLPEEPTLGERLNPEAQPEISSTQLLTNYSSVERPNASSMTQMLEQALHSDDDKLIDNVLYKTNKETTITRTVKKLTATSVIPLMNKILNRIQRNPSRGYELLIWIRVLMAVHITYLISMPNLLNRLTTLYQSFEARTKVYPKLSKLHGRLDLLLTHVANRKSSTLNVADVNESALVLQDNDESDDEESSDEEMDEKPESPESEDEDSDDAESEVNTSSLKNSENEHSEQEQDLSDHDSDI
ncbi:WD repeat-containing protein 43-like isoform X2 [Rhopilema esculentum]|uniref:WD repeat-containing protein 43-like isoform X2 n=1 Tax=Rhopilema esculentum TaxID=499914 RepID=UPI0031E1D056